MLVARSAAVWVELLAPDRSSSSVRTSAAALWATASSFAFVESTDSTASFFVFVSSCVSKASLFAFVSSCGNWRQAAVRALRQDAVEADSKGDISTARIRERAFRKRRSASSGRMWSAGSGGFHPGSLTSSTRCSVFQYMGDLRYRSLGYSKIGRLEGSG